MTRFVSNPLFERQLEIELRATQALWPAARAVAAKAELLAHHAMPRRGRRPIEAIGVNGEVVVANTNFGAHLEEFGEARTPTYAPLRRGARAAGLRLRES